MADYIKRVLAKAEFTGNFQDAYPTAQIHALLDTIPAADVVDGALFRDCRNELCLRCGQYRLRYKGACDGCRWMEVEP